MIIVSVKEGENIDKALKKLKRKFEKTGVVKELRDRQNLPSHLLRKECRK
jgi:small subunit ribosomal protein S21